MSTKCYLPVVHHQIFITWNVQEINTQEPKHSIKTKLQYSEYDFYSYLYIFFKICKI